MTRFLLALTLLCSPCPSRRRRAPATLTAGTAARAR